MLASLIVLVSAGAVAMTGFGFNLLSVPLLTFLYPPRVVVTVTLLLGLFVSGLLLARPEIRQGADWGLVRPLFLSSLVGMPGGLVLLLWSDPKMLRMMIASVTVLVAVSMLIRLRLSFGGSRVGAVVTGVLSGLLSTSTGFNGAPVAFYLLGRSVSKDRFRGTSVVFVFLATFSSVLLLTVSGAMTPSILKLGLAFAPSLLVGFGIGIVLAHRISQQSFEKLVLAFLAAVGVLNFWGTVW
jgi:uncharacterized protein